MTEPETHRTLLAPAFLPNEDVDPNASPPSADEWPTPQTEPVPHGEPLADVLAAGLKLRGWNVDYRWATFTGHALDARRADNRYDVEVVLLDTAADEGRGLWLVTAKRRSGFFSRWFPGRTDPTEHALLRRHLDEALTADTRAATDATRPDGGRWLTETEWRAQ